MGGNILYCDALFNQDFLAVYTAQYQYLQDCRTPNEPRERDSVSLSTSCSIGKQGALSGKQGALLGK